jgi:hypothetical protein
MALSVSAAALMVQVGHEMVPVVVMGPPLSGEVVAMLLTDPVPPGTAQVMSPRKNVVGPAEMPLLRCVTPRLPVTPVTSEMSGMSAATSDRKVGVPPTPFGAASTVFAVCDVTTKLSTGVEVGVETLNVAKGPSEPVALKLVMPPPLPLPGPITLQVFTPVQATNLPAVRSHNSGICCPTVGGLQLGRGSVEV